VEVNIPIQILRFFLFDTENQTDRSKNQYPEIRRAMNSVPRWFFLCAGWLVVFSSCLFASAQQSTAGATAPPQIQDASFHRTWQIGAYGSGGFAPNFVIGNLDLILYQKEEEFYTLTFEAGRMLTAGHGPGILKGRVEALGEITPFWITHSPAQENILHSNNPFLNGATAGFGPYSIHGLSFTPVLLRWNFMNHNSNRHVPGFRLERVCSGQPRDFLRERVFLEPTPASSTSPHN
jgi:hypothetical protein